ILTLRRRRPRKRLRELRNWATTQKPKKPLPRKAPLQQKRQIYQRLHHRRQSALAEQVTAQLKAESVRTVNLSDWAWEWDAWALAKLEATSRLLLKRRWADLDQLDPSRLLKKVNFIS